MVRMIANWLFVILFCSFRFVFRCSDYIPIAYSVKHFLSNCFYDAIKFTYARPLDQDQGGSETSINRASAPPTHTCNFG